MTIDDRARGAAAELQTWVLPDGDGGEPARRRRARRQRRGALGGALLAVVAATVLVWPVDGGQLVVAGPVSATGTDGCLRGEESDMNVYLSPGTPRADVEAVGDRLDADPRVASTSYLDDRAVYDLFRTIYATDPEMLGAVGEGDLTTVYRVVLHDPSSAAAFVDELQGFPGVYEATFPDPALREPGPDGSTECPRRFGSDVGPGGEIVLPAAQPTTTQQDEPSH